MDDVKVRRGKKSQTASGVWLRDLESFGAIHRNVSGGKGTGLGMKPL